jgi:2-polyprenyl-3-methyl-5-hydroxy-6-metoxy-1,4-benzoquinol methylase
VNKKDVAIASVVTAWGRVEGNAVDFVYDTTIDPNAENNSHALCIQMTGYNKSVLEVGCATGYVSKVLLDRGCQVIGMEMNAEAAEVAKKWIDRVIVGDIEDDRQWAELADQQFDVVMFADVLEHLRDPLTALRNSLTKLKPSGYVILSVPNVAHGDVRLSLLQGRFEYQELGLLDQTHIKFFTLESLRELLHQAGLTIVELHRVVVPLFESEIHVNRDDVNPSTLQDLEADREAKTYQFVVKAVRNDAHQAVAELADRIDELTDEVHRARDLIATTEKAHSDLVEVNAKLTEENRQLLENWELLSAQLTAFHEKSDDYEHSIAAIRGSLDESEERLRALLATRTFRSLALPRRLYGSLRRKPG